MFISIKWSWVCLNIALILCSTLNDVTEACQAALVGTVYCDSCFRRDFTKSFHFISGASVAVECGGEEIQAIGGIPRFRKEVITDVKGEFKVKLPFSATKHVKEIMGCSVKLISSNEPDCAVAATATSSSIQLKVKTPKSYVFTAGIFTFQPLEQPKLCHLNARDQKSNDEISASTPLPSPVVVVDELLAPPSHPTPTTLPISHVPDGKQTEIELHDLDDKSDFGFPNLPNQFLPPSLIPFFQNQPPPDSVFTPDFQPPPPPDFIFTPDFHPPPNSIFTRDFQPPPDSIFTPDFQPPPPSDFNLEPLQPPPPSAFNPIPLQPPSDFNPVPLQPPPPSDFNSIPLQPPSDFNPVPLQPPPPSDFNPIPLLPPPSSDFNPFPLPPPPPLELSPVPLQPTPSEFNPMPQQPPSPSEFNPIPLQPPPDSAFDPVQLPPDSTLNPLQTPPESTFDPLQPSPPSLTPLIFTPPPPIPSTDSPPLEQPDVIQATPPPPLMLPPPTLMPPFPPFPFEPGQALPGTPPPTKKTLSP